MEEIAAGNLDISFSGIKQRDEIGQLAKKMNTMQKALSDKSEVIRGFAGGDFSLPVPKVSERDELGHSLQHMKESIHSLLVRINKTVNQVTSGISQVASAGQSLSQGAMEQASSLEEITSGTVEIKSQSTRNAESAQEAFTIAKKASEEAENGNIEMQRFKEIMERINASSDEINKVVKVIDDISFQINLLALNANVEAARAGKYGKGFAVVAEEVRNLAVRSASSVKETSKKVDETLENIHQGNQATAATAAQLGAIVKGSDRVAAILEEIASASKDQVHAIEQVTLGLEQIDETNQSNAASAEESASVSEELATQAALLQQMVDRFILDEKGITTFSRNEE